MKFRTETEPLRMSGMITHQSRIMLIGSCFSDNIGLRLRKALFDVNINPFGITFNPLSAAKCLQRIIAGNLFTEAELFLADGLWHSWMHHSVFSHAEKSATLKAVNSALTVARNFLAQANVLVVTWGTAYLFELKETGEVVNNCHKGPSAMFNRRLAKPEEITGTFTSTLAALREFNPQIKVIITVSPVRHLADGLPGNSLSKSTLRVTAGNIEETEGAIYFPSFEAVIDDLRDYRFYAPDMTHPSEQAVEYIYDLFMNSFCDASTIEAQKECSRFTRRLSHRVLSTNPEAAARWQSDTLEAYATLRTRFPYLPEYLPEI